MNTSIPDPLDVTNSSEVLGMIMNLKPTNYSQGLSPPEVKSRSELIPKPKQESERLAAFTSTNTHSVVLNPRKMGYECSGGNISMIGSSGSLNNFTVAENKGEARLEMSDSFSQTHSHEVSEEESKTEAIGITRSNHIHNVKYYDFILNRIRVMKESWTQVSALMEPNE